MATLVGCAGGTAVDPVIACRDAARAHKPEALADCAAVFAQTGAPAAGGGLGRALLDVHATERLEALALDVGDRGGADAWAAVGDAREAAGDHAAAVVAYKRALDHRDRDDWGAARDAYALARIGADPAVRNYVDVVRFAGVAYQRVRPVQDAAFRGYILVGIAEMIFEMGDIPAVESLVAEAETVVDENSRVWGHLRLLQGHIERVRHRNRLARRALTAAADWFANHGLEPQRRATWLSLAEMAVSERDFEAASRALESARSPQPTDEERAHYALVAAEVALAHRDTSRVLELLGAAPQGSEFAPVLEAMRGRALAEAGRTDAAFQAFRGAIDALEARRDEMKFDALKPWALADYLRSPYEDLFRLYVEQSRPLDAFAIADRAKARSLLDLVSHAAPARSVEQQLVQAGVHAEGVRALLHASRSSVSAEPLGGQALLDKLGPRCVLSYFRARDELWLMALPACSATHDGLQILKIGSVAQVEAQVTEWLAHPESDALADTLGGLLLPPDVLVPDVDTVTVIVDDPVREVPFAALRRNGGYAVERSAFAYAPSASVLVALHDLPQRSDAVIVLGDATGDLPAARREAAEVAKMLHVDPNLGTAATRADVFSAGGGSLLHVATHAQTIAGGPALMLADGPVTAGDIIDHGSAPHVVVLASCACADPRDRAELGPLASAFLAAGASSVVASRWSVADDVALEFSRTFYQAGGAKDPVAATAAAQRALIKHRIPLASWSTFVVYGGGT